MKFFTIICAIYLLTLSCVSCMCDDMTKGDTTKQATTNNPIKEKSHDDNCTPFCTCTCCPASACFHIKTDLTTTKPIEFIRAKRLALVDKDYSSYNCHNIWQPPKLSC